MEMGTEGIPATRHTRGLRTLGLRVPPAAPEPRHPPELSGSVRGSLHSGARRGRPVCATSLVVARSSQIKTFQRSMIDRSQSAQCRATTFLQCIVQAVPRCHWVGCLDWSMIPGLGASIDAGIPGDFRASGSLMSWVQIAVESTAAGKSHPTHSRRACAMRN